MAGPVAPVLMAGHTSMGHSHLSGTRRGTESLRSSIRIAGASRPPCSTSIHRLGARRMHLSGLLGQGLRANGSWCGSFLTHPTLCCSVGFSFSEDPADYDVDDTRTAEDLYQFLLKFLERHPELASREVFIAGESYAGVYVPMFAARVMKGNSDSEVGGSYPLPPPTTTTTRTHLRTT